MSDGVGSIGRLLILAGLVLAGVGLLLMLVARLTGLRIGRLPGDIYIVKDGFRFYFPLMTSILLSILISLVLWLLRRK
jgi:DUF2905 family protein